MNLKEYAEIIGETLIYAEYDWGLSVQLEHSEVKQGEVLIGEYGKSYSGCRFGAELDYIRRIKGKLIVFYACTDFRREFIVPMNLTPTKPSTEHRQLKVDINNYLNLIRDSLEALG